MNYLHIIFFLLDQCNQYDNINSYFKTANETASKIQENTQYPDKLEQMLGLITSLKSSMKKLEDFDTIFQENGEKVKVLLKGLTFHGKIDVKKGRKRKSTNSFVTNNVSLPKSPKRLSPSVTEKIIAKHQRPSTGNVRLESR